MVRAPVVKIIPEGRHHKGCCIAELSHIPLATPTDSDVRDREDCIQSNIASHRIDNAYDGQRRGRRPMLQKAHIVKKF